MPNSKSQAGTKAQQRTEDEVTTSSSHNAKPHVTCRVDDTRMDFGGWILGEIWAKRLINKPDCWYRNNKKVSIVDLHRSWQHGR